MGDLLEEKQIENSLISRRSSTHIHEDDRKLQRIPQITNTRRGQYQHKDLVPRGIDINYCCVYRRTDCLPFKHRGCTHPIQAEATYERRHICALRMYTPPLTTLPEDACSKSPLARLPPTATQHARDAPGRALTIPAALPFRASFLASNAQAKLVKHVATRKHVRSPSPPRARTTTAAAAARGGRGGDSSRPISAPPPPRRRRPGSDRRPSRGPRKGHQTHAVAAAGAGFDASCSPLSLVEPAEPAEEVCLDGCAAGLVHSHLC